MDTDAFLAQEIASSSPARLRYLLIQKAVGLCKAVEAQWSVGDYAQSVQWTIRIQDILSELLDGVQAGNNPLAAQVSDLYVYVLKLFVISVQEQDLQGLRATREILEVEQETWSQYVTNETISTAATNSSHISLSPSSEVSSLASSTMLSSHNYSSFDSDDDDDSFTSLDLHS